MTNWSHLLRGLFSHIAFGPVIGGKIIPLTLMQVRNGCKLCHISFSNGRAGSKTLFHLIVISAVVPGVTLKTP